MGRVIELTSVGVWFHKIITLTHLPPYVCMAYHT